jgi:hypothetical protein
MGSGRQDFQKLGAVRQEQSANAGGKLPGGRGKGDGL